jgi:hypothetical protein
VDVDDIGPEVDGVQCLHRVLRKLIVRSNRSETLKVVHLAALHSCRHTWVPGLESVFCGFLAVLVFM